MARTILELFLSKLLPVKDPLYETIAAGLRAAAKNSATGKCVASGAMYRQLLCKYAYDLNLRAQTLPDANDRICGLLAVFGHRFVKAVYTDLATSCLLEMRVCAHFTFMFTLHLSARVGGRAPKEFGSKHIHGFKCHANNLYYHGANAIADAAQHLHGIGLGLRGANEEHGERELAVHTLNAALLRNRCDLKGEWDLDSLRADERNKVPNRRVTGLHSRWASNLQALDVLVGECIYSHTVKAVDPSTSDVVHELPAWGFNHRRFLDTLPSDLATMVYILPGEFHLIGCGREASGLRTLAAQGLYPVGVQSEVGLHTDILAICLCGKCSLQSKPGVNRVFTLDQIRRVAFVVEDPSSPPLPSSPFHPRRRQPAKLLLGFRRILRRKYVLLKYGPASRIAQKYRLIRLKAKQQAIATLIAGPNAKGSRIRLEGLVEQLDHFVSNHGLGPEHRRTVPAGMARRPASTAWRGPCGCGVKDGVARCNTNSCGCVSHGQVCTAECHKGKACTCGNRG